MSVNIGECSKIRIEKKTNQIQGHVREAWECLPKYRRYLRKEREMNFKKISQGSYQKAQFYLFSHAKEYEHFSSIFYIYGVEPWELQGRPQKLKWEWLGFKGKGKVKDGKGGRQTI